MRCRTSAPRFWGAMMPTKIGRRSVRRRATTTSIERMFSRYARFTRISPLEVTAIGVWLRGDLRRITNRYAGGGAPVDLTTFMLDALLEMSETVESTPERPLNPGVLASLVNNHREFLAFLQNRVGDRAMAEDILQEAFVRGLDKLGGLEKDEAAIAWFYRVLRNAVIDHHRRRAVVHRKLEAFASELEGAAEPGPELHGEVCRCVGELAGTLKPEYSEALKRVELDGLAV